jgi:hypothetical protein
MAKCPACPKQSGEIGVVLHYEKALTAGGGLGHGVHRTEPHVQWAEHNGILTGDKAHVNHDEAWIRLARLGAEAGASVPLMGRSLPAS